MKIKLLIYPNCFCFSTKFYYGNGDTFVLSGNEQKISQMSWGGLVENMDITSALLSHVHFMCC